MHALRASTAFAGGIYWPRALDLAWALTANLAIWMLLLKAPSAFAA
jgi:hypothetical protein